MTIRRSVGSAPVASRSSSRYGEQVLGGEVVEVVLGPQPVGGLRPALGALREVRLDRAGERPELPAELHRPPDGVAVPERQLARDARGGRHRDPVGADVLDPPRARAEDDDVAVHAGPQLVDHLLVELADAPPRRPRLALEEHGYRPRSGIVPPLVTATTRASRRPSTTSVTRSQTTRA